MKKLFQSHQNILWTTLLILLFSRLITLWVWPIIDPTEGRYAETARQMIECNDWLIPHVWISGNLVPFLGKPPLYFWTSASWIELLGPSGFAVRMGSLTGLILTLLSIYVIGKRYFSIETVLRMMIVVFSGGLLFAISGTIGVDMLLAGTIALAYMSYFAWTQEKNYWVQQLFSTLFFIGIALSFLTKGAVGIVTLGMPIFVWHCIFGGWKMILFRHAWFFGTLLLLLITAPWFYLAQQKMATEGVNFIRYFFIEEHLNRFISKDYFDPYGSGHVMRKGTSILFMLVATLPWGLFLILFFKKLTSRYQINSIRKNIFWQTPQEAFFFLGFAINTLFWCFATQFLITYFVPFAIFFAIWFVLRFEAIIPQCVQWIPRIGIFMAIAMIAVYFIAGFCFFPWAQGKQYAFKHFEDEDKLAQYDQLLNEGRPFKIAIFEPRNFSAIYFHGEKSNRILFNTDTKIEISKKAGKITFTAKKALVLNQKSPVAEALKTYTQKDGVLYIVSKAHLEKPLGFGKKALRWTPLMGQKIHWSDDGKRLILGGSDSERHLNIIDEIGEFLLLHPINARD